MEAPKNAPAPALSSAPPGPPPPVSLELHVATVSGLIGAGAILAVVLLGFLIPSSTAAPWRGRAFVVAALAASLFYGLGARAVFTDGQVEKQLEKAWGTDRPYRMHQLWFNFFGSLVGWGCSWPVLQAIWANPDKPDLKIAHAFYAVVAFLGITGYLPWAMAGLAGSFKTIVDKLK